MRLEVTIRLVLLCALFCAIDEVSCKEVEVPPPSKYDGKEAMEQLKKNRDSAGAGGRGSLSRNHKEPMWELSGLYEGDILLPDYSPGRNGVRGDRFRWPYGVIPYHIKPSFGSGGTEVIMQAMKHISSLTCITFRPWSRGDTNWISVTNQDEGCWSLVGKQFGGQSVNLGSGCVTTSIATHELLHAVGFMHQQSASDRDDFVIIKWENIKHGFEDQFEKYSESFVTEFGIPYDYGSIMHYSPYAFSKSDQPTIVAKEGNPQIGPGEGMTESDVKKVRIMYSCDEKPNPQKNKRKKWKPWWWWIRPLSSPDQSRPAKSKHSPTNYSVQYNTPAPSTETTDHSMGSAATGTSSWNWYCGLSLALGTAAWTELIVH